MKQFDAWLHTESWAGHLRQPVVVVAETKTRYRIRQPEGKPRVRLGGSRRFIEGDQSALVPKYAVSKRRS